MAIANLQLRKLDDSLKAARAQQRALVDAAEKDDRDLTEDEKAAFDSAEESVRSLESRIDRLNKTLDANAAASRPDAVPEAWGPSRIEAKGPVIEADPKRGFKTLGEFGLAVMGSSRPGQATDERLGIMAAISGAGQAVGADGGFLVPPEFSTSLWNGITQSPDSLIARTDQYTVTGDSLTFNANAETSRAVGSRWGGIRAYWIAEAAQMTASKPTVRQVKIEPQQLAVMCYATDKLLRNAPAVEQWLTRAATDEINFFIGDAIINGDGVGKPLGVLAADATVSVSKESGQGAATIQTENIAKMWARLHPACRQNAVWFVNNEVEEQFDYMHIAIGTGGVPVYLPPGGLADAPYGRLKGRPVIPIEYCAALGTVGDVILADLSAYVTGLRGGVQSDMSMHLRFDYNETCFRFLFEIDGRPWLAAPITPYKATSGKTLSSFVTLATR